MCGRVIQKTPLSEIRVLFEAVNPIPNSPSNFNAAPTQVLPVVRLDREGRRSLDLLRWGLIPFWAKDATIGAHCINAMAETVTAKPAFREAFRRGRRCLVPVDGFYEWAKTPKAKQPYLIGLANGSPLALAGLWEQWKDPRQAVRSCRPSPCSRRNRTSFAPPFTIECRQSLAEKTGRRGSVRFMCPRAS
jgi:putative SOS response-associated peptidase YedK